MGSPAPRPYSGLTCGRCQGRRFWDNGSKKRSGQWKAKAPDLTCVKCRKGVWLEDVPRRELVEPEPLPKNLPPVERLPLPEGRPSSSPFFS